MDKIIEKARYFFSNYSDIPGIEKLMPEESKKVLFNINDESFCVAFKQNNIEVIKEDFDKKNMQKLFDLIIDSDFETINEIFDSNLTPAEAYQDRRIFFHGIPYKGYPWLTRFIRVLQKKRIED